MPRYSNESMDQLFSVLAGLGTADECRDFMEDLCTIKELQDMAQRFRTAQLLSRGETYQAISEKVGVSTATISRVNRSLNYGSGGYARVIELLEGTEDSDDDQ